VRILIVTDGIYPYSMGGSHRLVYELAKSLYEMGHFVTCIVPAIDKSSNFATEGDASELAGVRVIRFQVDNESLIKKAWAYFRGFLEPVQNELESGNYDVLNVHYLPALFSLQSLTSRWKVRYTFHGPWAAEFRLSFSGKMDSRPWLLRFFSRRVVEPLLYFFAWRLERVSLRSCDRFFVLSDYMKGILKRDYGVRGERVQIAPAGVDHERFRPGVSKELRNRLAGDKSTVFITIRRLEKRMGLDILLQACALLKTHYEDFVLLIGGKGPHHAYLEFLLSNLGLEDHVKLLGFVPENELRGYLASSDLFILPSLDLEGFGLVVLESLACGTPVLVPPTGGPQEVVRKFDTAFVLDQLTPEHLSNRMLHLVQSGLLPRSRSAATTFAASYSWRNFTMEYLSWCD
jgi:glycosyltransferase involved in cell wall biosynthesis